MAISFVQQASTSGYVTGSQSKAFGSNNTAKNLLLVGMDGSYTGSTPPTIFDTLGNTYILIGSAASAVNESHKNWLWAVLGCKAGANSVTVTPVSGNNAFGIAEFSGVNFVDVSATNGGAGVTSEVYPNIQTNFSNELVFAFGSNNGQQGALSTPWNGIWTIAGFGFGGYQIVSSTGIFGGTATVVNTTNWGTQTVGFYNKSGVPNSLMLMGVGT